MKTILRSLARPPFASLRARLLVLIALATLPAALFILFVAAQEQAAVLARLESDARHVALLASREHSMQIRGARELMRWLGAKLSEEGAGSPIFGYPDFFRTLLAGHPQLANIGLLSSGGDVLSSAYPLPPSVSMAENPAFLRASKSTEVETGTYLVSPITKRPTLNYAFAVRDSDGRIQWVLFCGLDLNWLTNISKAVNYQGPFSMLIADREGRILTYAGAEGASESNPGAWQIPEIPAISESSAGRAVQIRGTNLHRYFVSTRLEGDSDLYVAVSLPYERILGESKSTFIHTMAILLLMTLLTTTAVYFATEIAVLRALRMLARAVRRFGAGDLQTRVPESLGYSELASLGRTFNTMADTLARRHQEGVEAEARLRALSTRLRQVREAEATRISRELHDEIGQLLTSLKFELTRLPDHCRHADGTAACAARLRDNVGEMNRQISAALDFVRRIASDLRPSVLDKLGLAAGLEWQARELETRAGLLIDVDADELDPEPVELVSVTLFRIAQEALTNTIRHAKASLVEVRLSQTEEFISLQVRDDGVGFSPETLGCSTSLGIVGMRERAILIGGDFSIESTPEHGTTVRVRIPSAHNGSPAHALSTGG